jgi:hypothetical protein
MMADGWLQGRLDLPTPPAPELLALPNPYDPEQQQSIGPKLLLDASLHQGKFYLYFAPLPGVARAAWTAAFGPTGSAGPFTLAYGLIGYAAWVSWLHVLRRRFTPDVSPVAVDLLAAALAFGGVWMSLVARPSIYTEAILAGSMFATTGLLLATPDGGRLRTTRTAAAGLAFACAVACRYSLVGYAVLFGAAVALDAARRRSWRPLLAGALPMVAVAAALASYNYARFGSPLEYGARYQMTAMRGAVQRIDPGCFPENVKAYFGYRPKWMLWFPFHLSRTTTRYEDGKPDWVLEGSFAGVAWTAPLALLAPAGLVAARRSRAAWVAAGGAALGLALLLNLGWAAARYQQDFLPAGTALGLVGIGGLAAGAAAWRRRAAVTVAAALASFGAVYGTAMAVNEVNIWRIDRARDVAFWFDSAQARAMERLGLDWRASYGGDKVARRPLQESYWLETADVPPAIFLPRDATLRLGLRGQWPSGSLQYESFADGELKLTFRLNDGEPIPRTLEPGWSAVDLPGLSDLHPDRPLRLQVSVDPDSPAQPTGPLLPVRLRGL